MGKLWWITGGGSGIGRELALQIAAAGDRVVISGRRLSVLQDAAGTNANIMPHDLDVTDARMVSAAVAEIETTHGPIDCAVLNAGHYDPMDIADFTADRVLQTFATNVQGVANCLDPLLKSMRRRGTGQIAIVASVAGYRGLPKAAAYGASKAALINMAEALKPEADAAGIKLQLVNPGFVLTPMTKRNDFPMPFLLTPEDAARRIRRGLAGTGFEIVFPWRFALLLKLGRLLPYRLYFALTRRMIGR
ncbi:SDR family NAD(P)-dependent oxidoreductase [Dongia rigui]|uniref:SDR family NAD(P)-dependent oxidoreductase n=1 Tax=Dongia rigui TaxID=940149 RepID=A0ABU5E383_9PROT|nr:SDR family NAD(P)-dependent oxidoreductase [Dongia rigui]MDY0873363.1 SDR family NAD(P)-dependent oxidoreductase [Dongia rigui]